ncbi:MAG TPA: DUF935 family protein, partial [Syntrophales bacterium]|nr:DUF935 family protein [Syntrophales bacterium]
LGDVRPEPPGKKTPLAAKFSPQARFLPGYDLVIASGEKIAFTPDQEAVEGLVDAVLDQAAYSLAGNEQAILAAVQASDSYEEAMQRVLELYPAMNMDELALLLENAGLNAEAFGRYTAVGEGK